MLAKELIVAACILFLDQNKRIKSPKGFFAASHKIISVFTKDQAELKHLMQCVAIMTMPGLNLPGPLLEPLPESPPESLPESLPEFEYHEQKSSNSAPRNRRQILENGYSNEMTTQSTAMISRTTNIAAVTISTKPFVLDNSRFISIISSYLGTHKVSVLRIVIQKMSFWCICWGPKILILQMKDFKWIMTLTRQ